MSPFKCVYAILMAGIWALASPAAANDWKVYSFPDEGFSVEFPAQPISRKVPVSPELWIGGMLHITKDDVGTEYIGQGLRYQPGSRDTYSMDELFRNAIDGVGGAGKCSIRSERPFSFPGADGAREIVFENCAGGNASKARFIMSKDWHYLVFVLGRPGVDQSRDGQRFLDSVRLTRTQ